MILPIKYLREIKNVGLILIFIAIIFIINHLLKDYFGKASLKFDFHQVEVLNNCLAKPWENCLSKD
jgi:hypothetical protein